MGIGTDDGQYFADEGEYAADTFQSRWNAMNSKGVEDRTSQSVLDNAKSYFTSDYFNQKVHDVAAHPLMSSIDRANAMNAQENPPDMNPKTNPMGSELGLQSIEGLAPPAPPFKPDISSVYDPKEIDKAMGIALAFSGGGLTFGGVTSKMLPKDMLYKAQNMELDMAHPDDIWNQTGFFRGADNRWRYEIPDQNANLKVSPDNTGLVNIPQPNSTSDMIKDALAGKLPSRGITKLSDVLDHPELFKAYPELANKVLAPLPQHLIDRGIGGIAGREALYMAPTTPEEFKSILLHESQHYIQRQEGFAKGGNARMFEDPTLDRAQKMYDDEIAKGTDPKSDKMVKAKQILDEEQDRAYRVYHRLMGEVEARNVQARMNFGPTSRSKIPPYRSEDTPRFRQVDVEQALSANQ